MRWDYRLVRRVVDGEERLSIHRAFYSDAEDQQPKAVSLTPCTVEGPDPAEILSEMTLALSKPVVEFSCLTWQESLSSFLADEDRRLFVGLLRKADGMDHCLAQLRENDAPLPPDWPDMEPPDMDAGGYIAFIRKRPQADFLVEFPDLPGCVAQGHSLEQARSQAQKALSRYIASGKTLPPARDWHALSVDPARDGAILIVVPPYPEASSP
jgi:predicted RNase H-like HicB family nuclease